MKSDSLKLRILVNNHARSGMVEEHGFSMWIETPDSRILFDTGQGKALRPNTERTQSDPARADILVLSHGHYDHTGAVDYVLQQNPSITVFAHPAVLHERFSIHPGKAPENISMPTEQRQQIRNLPDARLNWVKKPIQIAPDIYLTGPVPRLHPLEDTGGPFFRDSSGRIPDLIPDDLSMWIKTPDGVIVICGCCHSGLINTVNYIRKISGEERIRGIIGGLHLKHASAERLAATREAIWSWNPDVLVPCHCTGEKAVALFTQLPPLKTKPGYAGMKI